MLWAAATPRRLEEALQAKGIPTGSILANGWRATKKSAEDMAAHVRAELAERYYSAVVFQLLDNNIFFSKFEDGSLCPARKTSDGHYHVDRELVVASRESQFAILKICTPLWEAAKGRHMVVVGPMPRYVTKRCCPEPDHVTNRARPEFYAKMKDDLVSCGTAIKDFLFTSGLRNGRVMDPGRQLRGLAAAEIWGTDPVHPKKEVYGLLANGVIEVERMWQRPLQNKIHKRRRAPYCRPPRRKRGGSFHRGPDTRAEKRQHRRQLRLEGRRPGTRRRQVQLEARRTQQLEGAVQGRKRWQERKGPLGEALLAVGERKVKRKIFFL